MNHRTDQEHLLTDVFADEPGFRKSLFAETARLAGRRRRGRKLRRALLSCAAVVGLTVALWPQPKVPRQVVEAPAAARGYGLVVSQPTLAVVTTQPFAPPQEIISDAAVPTVHTVFGAGLFQEIGDEALLALVPGPAVLVRRGPHSAELIIVDRGDSAPN